jgi:hypothetical protein
MNDRAWYAYTLKNQAKTAMQTSVVSRDNMKVPRWAGAPPRKKKKDEQPAR